MKRLLAALLPSESREHVLGDLAQRGYRWADILSVLPRVWFSHLRRALYGPVPSLAGASEPELRQRCWQMELGTLSGITAYFVLKCAAAWLRHSSFGMRLFLVTCLLASLVMAAASYVRRRRTPHCPPGYWLRCYRVMLTVRTGWKGYAQPALLASSVLSGLWSVPIILVIALWALRRHIRIRAELAYFDNNQEPLS